MNSNTDMMSEAQARAMMAVLGKAENEFAASIIFSKALSGRRHRQTRRHSLLTADDGELLHLADNFRDGCWRVLFVDGLNEPEKKWPDITQVPDCKVLDSSIHAHLTHSPVDVPTRNDKSLI